MEIKRPTRCNRWFFIEKTYCSLNMLQAPLCPSSGARVLYRWLLPVVLGALVYRLLVWCGAVGCVSSLWDATCKPKHQVPPAATICIILLSSWWWAWWCPKHVERTVRFCNKKPSVASSWPFYFHVSELNYCSITRQKVRFPVATAMRTSNLTLWAYCFSKYDAFAHK
jgi:hypothetical protein